jgi:hypothetical protein
VHRRAQVTEPRHRDDPNALVRQRARKGHTLIEATTAAVNRQQGHALASFLVFDGTAGRCDQQAAMFNPDAGRLHIRFEAPPNKQRGRCKSNGGTVKQKMEPEPARTGHVLARSGFNRSATAMNV